MTKKVTFMSFFMMAFLMSACSERFTGYYPKYEDAVKDGAVKRGWIPEILPATATEIYEQHDLDTNNVWIRFALPSSDRDRLATGLKRLTDNEIRKIITQPPLATWWFKGLIQQTPTNDSLNANIYAMKCHEDKTGYLAFDVTGPKVYYWCTN